MRISNNNNKEVDVGNVSRAQKNAKKAKTNDAGTGINPGVTDAASVNISGEAKALSQANKVARSEDTDQAKIDRIKAMVNEGSYKPDYGKVADKMVNEQLMQELA